MTMRLSALLGQLLDLCVRVVVKLSHPFQFRLQQGPDSVDGLGLSDQEDDSRVKPSDSLHSWSIPELSPALFELLVGVLQVCRRNRILVVLKRAVL